ncbi:MAG: 20S proteasome subunit A/B [Chthoniobacterales bacterium]
MIEEPYRWVEAIANRREYIETQLAPGSPIASLSYRDGILFVTVGRARQKLFEIYDRIAMGAIGHPGDIERLRMAAIELASTEGFTRSTTDVSLRRLAFYSLSPLLKTAFEQVYGAPFLARMIFAEVGPTPAEDLFLRIEYDGAIAANGPAVDLQPPCFSAISGTGRATELMEGLLRREHEPNCTLPRAMNLALDAWSAGSLPAQEDGGNEIPSREALLQHRTEELRRATVEACVLERRGPSAIRYRSIVGEELKELTAA